MPDKISKNKNKTLFEENLEDTSVSDAINDAFDSHELSTIGKLCLDARVSNGLTQEQAGSMLKVRVKIIKDFENGDPIDLPGLAYKIGFVRSYARLLGLDSNFLVKEFKESLEIKDIKEQYKFLSPVIEKSKLLPMGAVFSLLIALIIYSGWYYSERSNRVDLASKETTEIKKLNLSKSPKHDYVIIENNNSIENIVVPKKNENYNKTTQVADNKKIKSNQLPDQNIINETVAKNKNFTDFKKLTNNDINENEIENFVTPNKTNEMSAEAKERNPSTELVLKAIGNSWVEIEDIDGNILMTRLMRPGETYVVPNITGLTFNTGNAGALSLYQGDKIIPSLGELGEIISARPLNIKAFSN